MAEPALGATAAQVRRDDPLLFRTALFAPEPERSRLMTLYAFDIELSRALSRTREPMIARMRLQWWRDVIEEAEAGAPARQHEVAVPLNALLAEGRLSRPQLDGLVDAREAEIAGLDDLSDFDDWAAMRFGGLMRLAAAVLGADRRAGAAADAAARAMAAAFALRHAAPMAAQGEPTLLPGLAAESRSALARGETDEGARAVASSLAEAGLAALARARSRRREVPRRARPAFLPVASAEPVLRRAMRPTADLVRLSRPAGEGSVPGLLWRAISGRW